MNHRDRLKNKAYETEDNMHLDPMEAFVRGSQLTFTDKIKIFSLSIGSIGAIVAAIGTSLSTTPQLEKISTTTITVGSGIAIVGAIITIAAIKFGNHRS